MNFTLVDSAQSIQGRTIEAFSNQAKGLNKSFIYLLAGVHGDEVEGVYVLEKWIEWIKTQDLTKLALPIIYVPILNVDGYANKTRVNANGVDLNRNLATLDWANGMSNLESMNEVDRKKYYPGPFALSERENQFLIRLFESFPPRFCISFHSWLPMINYNGDCKEYADFLGSISGYSIVASVGYDTPGSLGTFLPEKFNTPVITYELPVLDPKGKKNSLESIWKENDKALERFFHEKMHKPMALT